MLGLQIVEEEEDGEEEDEMDEGVLQEHRDQILTSIVMSPNSKLVQVNQSLEKLFQNNQLTYN